MSDWLIIIGISFAVLVLLVGAVAGMILLYVTWDTNWE